MTAGGTRTTIHLRSLMDQPNNASKQLADDDVLIQPVHAWLVADGDGASYNPATGNNFAIQKASENGQTELVQFLLENHRVDPTAKDNYAIQMASKNGHSDVVRLLLKWERPKDDPVLKGSTRRVDPTDNYNYAIQMASENGHSDVVKVLLVWLGPDGERVPNDINAIQMARKNGRRYIKHPSLE